jgi:endonuclease YncB( thermonuclease family)
MKRRRHRLVLADKISMVSGGRSVLVVLFAVIAFMAEADSTGDLVGMVRIHDGDTLEIGDTKVRLEGIDAPETDQVCLTNSGELWDCGLAARDKLKAKIGMATVKCAPQGRDRYGRTLAVCSANNVDLNALAGQRRMGAVVRALWRSLPEGRG